jgi:hypothetical protein
VLQDHLFLCTFHLHHAAPFGVVGHYAVTVNWRLRWTSQFLLTPTPVKVVVDSCSHLADESPKLSTPTTGQIPRLAASFLYRRYQWLASTPGYYSIFSVVWLAFAGLQFSLSRLKRLCCAISQRNTRNWKWRVSLSTHALSTTMGATE